MLRIRTKNNQEELISGSLYVVQKKDGSLEGRYRDFNGEILIEHLAPAEYCIRQISAPGGYIIDNAPKSIVLSFDHITDLDIYNQPA